MIVVRSSEWVVSIHAMHDTTNVLGTHLFDKANDTTNVNYSNICLCYEKPCYESNEQRTDCQQLNQCQLINWSNNVNQPCLFYYIRQNCQLRSNIIRCCMIAAEDRFANASIQCIYPTPIRARSCVANAFCRKRNEWRALLGHHRSNWWTWHAIRIVISDQRPGGL